MYESNVQLPANLTPPDIVALDIQDGKHMFLPTADVVIHIPHAEIFRAFGQSIEVRPKK